MENWAVQGFQIQKKSWPNKVRWWDKVVNSHKAEIITWGKQYRWDSSQGLWMSSEENTKEWCRRRFWNILAQDFIIWLSWRMLVVKHIYLCQCNQGIMTKYSNSVGRCSITMIMMHSWDVWLQCWYNKMMDEMVHMTRCNCHDADPMMHTPWCKDDNALVWYSPWDAWVWCTHIWVEDAHDTYPVPILSELNLVNLTLLSEVRIVRTLVTLHKRGLQWVMLHIPWHQCAPSGSIMWLQRTWGPRFHRGIMVMWLKHHHKKSRVATQ